MYPETMVYLVGICYLNRICDYKMFIAKSEHEAIEMAKTRTHLYSDQWYTNKSVDEDGKPIKQDLYKVYNNNNLVTVATGRNPTDAINSVKNSLWHEVLSIKRQKI